MHPTMHYHQAKARIADLHQQAERDRMARAALLARKDGGRLLDLLTRPWLLPAALWQSWPAAACNPRQHHPLKHQ